MFIEKKNIRSGDIAVTTSNSSISEAIRWFEKGSYSHALTFMWVDGVLYCYEADGTNVWGRQGVYAVPFDEYFDKKPNSFFLVMQYRDSITEKQYSDLLLFLQKQIGKGYDYRGLAWQLKRYSLAMIGREPKRGHYTDFKKWYCSELTMCGQNLIRNNCPEWQNFSPQDVFELPNYRKYILSI